VKKVYLDSSQRLWFVTPENVGYTTVLADSGAASMVIPVTTFELPSVTPSPVTTVEPRFAPGISISVTPEQPASPPDPLTSLLETIQGFLKKLLGGGRA
jgi:hypothetical protein